MESRSGRFVIVFNGEIYNFAELRAGLDAHDPRSWRGGSDTEVVLAMIERHGVEVSVRAFAGMFAFALWDRELRVLYLVRDRFGVKPLVVAPFAGGVAFASTTTSLRRHPRVSSEVDPNAVRDVVLWGGVTGERTIFRGMARVAPGTIVALNSPDWEARKVTQYWNAGALWSEGARSPFSDTATAEHEVALALDRAVRRRLVADVPLGAFLSGGVDSSLVVASMARQSRERVRTFSLGHEDVAYDEASAAEAVARHLGTEHVSLRPSARDILAAAVEMPRVYDEPFADSSQVATYLVAKLARATVTVALSGDGGDELFAGYNRHAWAPHVWRVSRLVPRGVRAVARRLAARAGAARLDRAYVAAPGWLPRVRLPGRQLVKLARVATTDERDALYRELRLMSGDSSGLLREGCRSLDLPALPDMEFARAMMVADMQGYLPDDVLVKVDRATMAVGLEAREPLLDHEFVAVASRVPMAMNVRGVRGKQVLRNVLARDVPRALFERPKMGFAVPMSAWLRGPLREWSADALAFLREARIEDVVDHAGVEVAWKRHAEGVGDHADALWPLVMLGAWASEGARGS
jgi:asparagine synthase (glutamine-hydrolysing)